MNGREDSKQNDLFFLCSLIEYIGRQTKNERSVIVNALGRKGGHYDNVSKAEDGIPTHWDIGKVLQRIILKLADNSDEDIISALMKVYNSWIITKIDDYNSSMYYENTSYQYESLLAGKAL